MDQNHEEEGSSDEKPKVLSKKQMEIVTRILHHIDRLNEGCDCTSEIELIREAKNAIASS